MRTGSGCTGGIGFKACDVCGDVFNEIIARAEAFGGGLLGGPKVKTGVVVLSTMNNGSGGWTWKKGGKDVVAVVKGG